jgi:hypothetical protein
MQTLWQDLRYGARMLMLRLRKTRQKLTHREHSK